MQLRESGRNFFLEVGSISRFSGWFFREALRPRYEWRELVRQCYEVGYKSFPLVALTGFIMGLVLTMQLRPTMMEYGIDAKLPIVVSLSVVREIGPVITALIFAGKVGSGIGAELGSMNPKNSQFACETTRTT